MKGKQKKIIICGILLVLLVGAVIGIKSYQDRMKNRLWSSKWEDSFWNLNNENYMTDGILRQQDSYIRFCDNSTGKDDLICVDQNCSHEASKDSACGAYIYASQLAGIAIRGSHIMYVADSKDDYGKYALYVADLEGKDRRKLADLMQADQVYDVLYHGSMVYISYLQMEKDGQESTVYGIYAYDLQEKRGQNLFQEEGNNYTPDGMAMGEKWFYISYAYSDAAKDDILAHSENREFEKEHVRNCVKALDPVSGKVKESLDGFGNNNVLLYKNGYLFYTKDQDLYRYSEQNGSVEKINEKGDYIAMTGGAEGKAYFRMADPKTGKLMCAVYDIADGKWSSQVTEPFFAKAVRGDHVYGMDEEGNPAWIPLKAMEKGYVSKIHVYKSQWDAE